MVNPGHRKPEKRVALDLASRERRRNEMIDLYNQGFSFAEVGKVYGISKQRVHAIIRYR
jgi:predicted DNA-binding protein YlxM (UPF0122 family)